MNLLARIEEAMRRIVQLERRTPPHVTAATSTAAVAVEAAARAAADAAEATTRAAADTTLSSAITAEAAARASADTTLNSAISAEAITRAGADSALASAISAIVVPALSSATPSTASASAGAAGTSGNTSRADHAHQVSVGTPGAATVGATAAAGSASSLARSDHAHSFATGTPVAVTPDAAASIGSGGAFAHSNHQHGLATYATTPAAVGSATGSAGTSGTAPARGDHVHALTPADATHAGGIAASGSQPIGAQLQLPAGSTVAPYESWVNLTLNTNWSVWTTFGANYGFARYRRDALGHVELEVQVRYVGSGTAAWSGSIGALPSGYRPQVKHRVCADSGRSSGANDSYCSIDIDNVTGNLTVINSQQNSGTTYTWVCFRARFRSDT